ncbi:GIY-YIG nuclease family protein [Fluviicola taffensis]|uniref:GIY-YIG nuclease family protein n=1 Tax=Fluviicola taffensis TaxID=191579 RepID=UPI003137EA5A
MLDFFIYMTYYVYILYSPLLDKYYVGYSSDPWLRLKQHNENVDDKYTGRAKDWQLACVFLTETKSEAISIERFIKKQKSRKLLELLIDINFNPNGRLAQLVRVPHVRD